MVNPSFSAVQTRSASFATLEQRQADSAARHRIDGLQEPSVSSSETLLSVIGPKEQFFISPNALEASLYNVRGDSGYRTQDSDGHEGAEGPSVRDGVGREEGRWVLEGGGRRDVPGQVVSCAVDPSFFMIV